MVARKANPLRRHRAVTLIEAVLYISIALALIVGGLVFYQQASTAERTAAFVRQINALVQEATVLYNDPAFIKQTSFGYYGSDQTRVGHIIAASGGAPADTIQAGTDDGNGGLVGPALETSFVNPWGGATEVYVYRFAVGNLRVPMVSILSMDVPAEVCTRIVTQDANGRGVLNSSYAYYSVTAGGTVPIGNTIKPVTPTIAGTRCRKGMGALNAPDLDSSKPRVLWIGFDIAR